MLGTISKSTVHLFDPILYFIVGPLLLVSISYYEGKGSQGSMKNPSYEDGQKKPTYVQVLGTRPHHPALEPVFPMFHVPLAQILQSLLITPWPDRPFISCLSDVHKPSLYDHVFHEFLHKHGLAKRFAAFHGQFSAFVKHVARRDGAVIGCGDGRDFCLFNIAAWSEMSEVIKSDSARFDRDAKIHTHKLLCKMPASRRRFHT